MSEPPDSPEPPNAPAPWEAPKAPLDSPKPLASQTKLVLIGAATFVAVATGIFAFFGITWGLAIGLPFAAGLAFSAVGGPSWKGFGLGAAVVTAIPAVIGLVASLVEAQPMGLFCGLIGAAFLIPGYLMGFGAGAAAHRLDKKRIMLRFTSPLRFAAALASFPLLLQATESALQLSVNEVSIAAHRTIPASPKVVWNSPLFRGEKAPRTQLAHRMGLTRPTGAKGEAGDLGDRKTYAFPGGKLTIEITESREPSVLAFSVVEQVHVEDRAARFLGGQLSLQPQGDATRAEFSIRYLPKMTPRWLWYPAERWAAQTILREVLERMDASSAMGAELPMLSLERGPAP